MKNYKTEEPTIAMNRTTFGPFMRKFQNAMDMLIGSPCNTLEKHSK